MTTDRSKQLQTLSEQLAHELTLLRQLFDSLQQEHQCLTEKALDKLTNVVKLKQSQLDEFEAAVSSRMECLSKLGLDLDNNPEENTLKLIQSCEKDRPDIMPSWKKLEELLEQCKEQNVINGTVIEVSSHSLQTAYSILTAPVSGKADTYDAKGVSRKGGGTGNSLAKA